MPKGSDLLVAALENEGVDRIFGVPGEENLDVVESLRKSSIKLILTRHEQGAAFMAATYGRLTGKPGVCITTLGPGALNLTTGAAYALLGAAASRPRSTAGIGGFVRRTQIPFFTTQMGKGTVPGGGNLYMGTAALSERDYVHDAIDRADLIIAIGHDTIEKPPFIMGPHGPQVIHVSYTPANVEQVYFPDAEVVGDVGPSLELLADRVEGKLRKAGALLSLREGILSRIADRAKENRWPPTPQRLVHDVRQAIPPDAIVALDTGRNKIWSARNYRTFVANTLLLDNALATMGAGLPSAMMAAMLYPNRRVMAVCGDGGFMMNSQEMETAVRLRLNLVGLILDDGAYGMIRWKQAVDAFPDFGLTFGNPDFVKYAESYGAKGARVEAMEDLVPTLEAAFKSGGVHLIAVPIDYSENTRVLVEELRSRMPL